MSESILSNRVRGNSHVPRRWQGLVRLAYVIVVGFMLTTLYSVLFYNAAVFSVMAITNISTTLLTVEGILIGLSLLKEAEGRTFPTFVALIALMWSIITIATAQVLSSLQSAYPGAFTVTTGALLYGASLYQVFLVNVGFFVATLIVYVLAVASFRLFGVERKRSLTC